MIEFGFMASKSDIAPDFQTNCTMASQSEISSSEDQTAPSKNSLQEIAEDSGCINHDSQNITEDLAKCQINHKDMQPDKDEPGDSGQPDREDVEKPLETEDRLEDEDDVATEDLLEDDVDGDMLALTLLTLPPELIWFILDFIEARFVVQQVTLVCKHLYDLINEDVTWKVRISKRWPKRYPIIPVDDDQFNWKLACIQREEQHKMWSDHEVTMESFCLSMGHFAAVDAVHLVQNGDICISGSRDRHVQIWDLTKLDTSEPKKSVEASRVKSIKAHKGWVWDITSLDNIAVTSSWDCWLKLWDMEQEFTEIRKIRGNSAFLSTVFLPDVLVSSSYNKTVYVHDHRADDPLVDRLCVHTRPVLSVAADSQYIISASEDKTIAVHDRRAGKLLKQIKLDSFSMGLSYGFNQLWTGQRDGTLHVLDATHGNFNIVESWGCGFNQLCTGQREGTLHVLDATHGNFNIVKTYDSGHKGKVTDVIHNLGAVITSSTDKTIKVHEPNHNPSVVTTHSIYSGDIAALHLHNNVLASACSDGTVGIWRPKAKSK